MEGETSVRDCPDFECASLSITRPDAIWGRSGTPNSTIDPCSTQSFILNVLPRDTYFHLIDIHEKVRE